MGKRTCRDSLEDVSSEDSSAMSTSQERDATRALNCLTREGLAYLGSADDSALRDFVHDFFGGDDPGYESPGK